MTVYFARCFPQRNTANDQAHGKGCIRFLRYEIMFSHLNLWLELKLMTPFYGNLISLKNKHALAHISVNSVERGRHAFDGRNLLLLPLIPTMPYSIRTLHIYLQCDIIYILAICNQIAAFKLSSHFMKHLDALLIDGQVYLFYSPEFVFLVFRHPIP